MQALFDRRTDPRGNATIEWVGDSALIIVGPFSPADVRERLVRAGIAGVTDIVPSSRDVLVMIDPRHATDDVHDRVAKALGEPAARRPARPAQEHEIVVCYDDRFAPDLAEVAEVAGMTPDEFAQRHASAAYEVEFVGFAPGFGYLSGLPERLRTPKLASPRPRVAAGSVAIADGYCGIYPLASPGGWRIIGRTVARLFDATRDPPALLRAGDRVRFRRVERLPGSP
ncbi:MAG: 5-oxoprolinase subunit PxpB [Planctomycetota bacterium]